MSRQSIARITGGVLVAVILGAGVAGCGPSAQDETSYIEFYDSQNEVWILWATELRSEEGDKDIVAKLDKAMERVERAAEGYKELSQDTRKKLRVKHKGLLDQTESNRLAMLDSWGATKRPKQFLIRYVWRINEALKGTTSDER